MFFIGSSLTVTMVVVYTHLEVTPLHWAIVVSMVMFIGIFSRIIPFQALMTQVPAPQQRGSFNAINASIQQISGGLAALVAGHIVKRADDGRLLHYPIAGYVVVASTLIACTLLWRINRELMARTHA
jgi:predicted MFS family arabinose efflux permease